MPLNVWDGTGAEMTDHQKAEMIAYVRASGLKSGWEDRVRKRYTEVKAAKASGKRKGKRR